MPNAGDAELRGFQQLLAEYMPFDLVIDEESASGEEARVAKNSVCGSWGAVIAGQASIFTGGGPEGGGGNAGAVGTSPRVQLSGAAVPWPQAEVKRVNRLPSSLLTATTGGPAPDGPSRGRFPCSATRGQWRRPA